MKMALFLLLMTAIVFSLAACSQKGGQEEASSPPSESSAADSEPVGPSGEMQPESQAPMEASSEEAIRAWVNNLGFSQPEDAKAGVPAAEQRRISVRFGENTVVYALNDGSAADSLYGMLPLTIEVEDYGTNEKIFYPEEGLDTGDSPLAQAGAGTLAYYEPWGDVVFFYGDYNENPGLFELGQVVSGGELISEMSGTITIEAVE